MNEKTNSRKYQGRPANVPVCPWPYKNGLPAMYGDEDHEPLGESAAHVTVHEIFHLGLKVHLRKTPRYRVFADLNLFLDPRQFCLPFVSPDIMVFDSVGDWDEHNIGHQYPKDGTTPNTGWRSLLRRVPPRGM